MRFFVNTEKDVLGCVLCLCVIGAEMKIGREVV